MKKNKFPDFWGVSFRSRKIPVTPVIPIFKRDTKTDSDFDGTPNFRDCQPLNPHKHSLLHPGKKRCIRCYQWKPIDEFSKKPGFIHPNTCKPCLKKYLKEEEERAKPIREEVRKAKAEDKKYPGRYQRRQMRLWKEEQARHGEDLYYCIFCKKTFPKKLMREYIYCPYCGDDVGVHPVRAYTRDELPGRPDTERGVPYYKKSRRR